MNIPVVRLAAALAVMTAPSWAATPDELARLREAMGVDELIAIVADEGVLQAEELQNDMLAGRGGRNWERLVRQTYDAETLAETFRAEFDAVLAPTDVTPLIAFYTGGLGPEVRDLELESRRAIIADDVEEAAKAQFEALRRGDAARVALLDGFVEAGDLIERNVEGALNSNLAFFKGLVDGGGFEMGEAEILSEVWSQESAIRSDTEAWIYGYLALAYDPLSDDELGAYVNFAGTEHGQDLNRALFAGFDRVFGDVSYDLGKAVSLILIGEET